ncbi:hypothetical protein [Azospirillum sp.]|uniref:hypothetical protein n=1 Tax=Azospirillum sp. TaxID=34012 RepID=UPI003D74CDC0
MNADDDERLRSMLASTLRLKTRLVETDVCMTASWRMLDSSRLTVAQCKRTLGQAKRG